MSSTLTIKHGTLLGFSHNVVDFGSDFRFGVRKVITVQVSELACGEKVEEGKIGSQAKALDSLADTKDYFELTINGHTFSEEYQLTGFTLEEGNWNVVTQGTLTMEAYTKGFIDFSNSEDYLGWKDISDEDFSLMEDFNDDFEFSRSANSISYSHNVLIKFSARADGSGITPPLGAGLSIANSLVNNAGARPDFAWLVESELDGLYADTGGYKRFITESVDEINSVVKVSEKFNAENLKSNYSFSAKQSVELLESGIVNVSEKGKVIGLSGQANRQINNAALEAEIKEAKRKGGRLEQVFNAHKANWAAIYKCDGGIPNLVMDKSGANVLLIKNGVTTDTFRGIASYDIQGTNDQRVTELAVHDYVKTIEGIDYDDDGDPKSYIRASQKGTFTGGASKNLIPPGGDEKDRPRFKEALEAWEDEKQDIKDSLLECIDSTDAYPASLSNTWSPYKGSVGYSMEFSNEPKYGTDKTEYKLWTINYNDSKNASGERCVFQNTVQNVVNHPDQVQLVQKRNTTELPNASASHRLVGKRDTTLKKLAGDLLGGDPAIQLKDLGVDGNNSDANPKKLKSADYTFNNDNDKILNVSFGWE